MLKKLLSAIAVGCFALCANAQDDYFTDVFSKEVQCFGIIPDVVLSEDTNNFWVFSDNEEDDNFFRFNEVSIYDEDLNLIKTISSKCIIPFQYTDAYRQTCRIPASQDLFNNDDKYEFITAASYYSEEGSISKKITGLSIVQDDGTVLASIPFNDGYRLPTQYYGDFDGLPVSILHLGGKYYLSVQLINDNSDIVRLYSFERGKISTSIKKVRDTPRMKVSPTLPQKNENIKIDLADMKSPNKLSVIDTNGKVCFTQTIQANQKNVELSTSGMPAGMYIIRVTDGNKEVDNCRVIIR